MIGEIIAGIAVILVCFSCALFAIFILKKKEFVETEKFRVFKNILFFPPIVNYWILKLFLLLGGLFLGGYLTYVLFYQISEGII